MPRRENTGRRRPPPFPLRRTILVYCGGRRTERDYFEALRQRLRASSVTVKILQSGIAPEALVRAAADYRMRRPGVFDEVWCVVDVDEFDIAAAATAARADGIGLAVSNPCFELWLLLHHTDCRAYCNGCQEVHRRLRKWVPGYDKARLNFAQFAEGVDDAVRRARDLDPSGTAYEKNPSTSVWRVVDSIREVR